jgi:hypothetical protein
MVAFYKDVIGVRSNDGKGPEFKHEGSGWPCGGTNCPAYWVRPQSIRKMNGTELSLNVAGRRMGRKLRIDRHAARKSIPARRTLENEIVAAADQGNITTPPISGNNPLPFCSKR